MLLSKSESNVHCQKSIPEKQIKFKSLFKSDVGGMLYSKVRNCNTERSSEWPCETIQLLNGSCVLIEFPSFAQASVKEDYNDSESKNNL